MHPYLPHSTGRGANNENEDRQDSRGMEMPGMRATDPARGGCIHPPVPRLLRRGDGMNSKRCTKCDEVKPISDFSRHRGHRDSLQYECKVCQRHAHIVAGRVPGLDWEIYPQLHDRAWLRRQWEHEGRDARDIAEMAGCRPAHVRRALNHHEIPIRRSRSPRVIRLLRAVERQREVRV